MITLDEAIKHCKEVAEELRNVDMGELDALYCGDTECIEARKNDCIECAKEHKQLAEWLTELKQFKEQEPCEDTISRQAAISHVDDVPYIKEHPNVGLLWEAWIESLSSAQSKRKVGEWIKKNNDYFDWYECSECGYGSDGEMKYNRLCDVRTKFCPDCGSQNLKGE